MDREAAFKQFCDAYRDRIYRMCCSSVPGEGGWKDLYQEVIKKGGQSVGAVALAPVSFRVRSTKRCR